MKNKISKPLKEGKTKYDKKKYIGELKAPPPPPLKKQDYIVWSNWYDDPLVTGG